MKIEKILKDVKEISIEVKRISSSIIPGKHSSIRKSRGIEFSEIREYTDQDDVRDIDWKSSAKRNKVYVKQFQSESKRNIFFLIDLSLSMDFYDKKLTAAKIFASLAMAALKDNDYIRCYAFSGEIRDYGEIANFNQIVSMIEKILSLKMYGESDLNCVLKDFLRINKKRGDIVIISDFLFENSESSERHLKKFYDLIKFQIYRKIDYVLPDGYIYCLQDCETNRFALIENFNLKTNDKFYKIDVGDNVYKKMLFYLRGTN